MVFVKEETEKFKPIKYFTPYFFLSLFFLENSTKTFSQKTEIFLEIITTVSKKKKVKNRQNFLNFFFATYFLS
jgi:hypothetical protein